jgi:serine/threonine-protein kinase
MTGAAPEPHSRMAERPERISHYHILEPIGHGAMGILYRARDTLRHREVALKVMTAEALQEPEARARFEHEAQLALRVQHRNIVRVFEAGADGDVPFIAMEFLRGQTLADRMAAAEPLELAATLDIVIQVCDGLQCLHEQGIVHRDVKPANIWLLEDGGVKLLDLGIAKREGVNLTQLGSVVGSTSYMSPEQLAGGAVDGRADVFSAAVVLYELLSGEKPFHADSITAVMMKVLHEPAPDIRTLVPGIPPALAQAIDTALRKDPGERYREAADFASDLRLARDGEVLPSGEPVAAPGVPEPTVITGGRRAAMQEAAAPAPTRDDARRYERPVASERPLDTTVVAERPRASATAPIDHDPVLRRAEELPPAAQSSKPASGSSRGRPLVWIAAGAAVLAAGTLAGVLFVQQAPAAPEYFVDVRSSPPGAEIVVDGARTGQQTPAVLRLPAPPARVGLTLDGYQSIDEPVAASFDSQRTLEYRLRRLLQVHSEPSGAQVVVDGQETGQVTPAAVPIGDPQPSTIELRLQGYESGRAPVTAALIEQGTLAVTLARAGGGGRGQAPAVASPVVTVSLSGSYRFGVTGCGVSSPASETHTVEVSAPCTLRLRAPDYFLDTMRNVSAPRGGRVELSAPPLVKVQLRSRHQDCTLLVGGRAVGSPPVDLAIAAGSYTAALQCPDGQTLQSRAFEIEAGQSVRRIDDYLR